jgi:hypothetical protein
MALELMPSKLQAAKKMPQPSTEESSLPMRYEVYEVFLMVVNQMAYRLAHNIHTATHKFHVAMDAVEESWMAF